MFFTIISYVAAIFTTAAFLPQAVKTIRTRDTSGISLGMYILFTIGVCLWLVYGIATAQHAIIAANAVTTFFAVIILLFKIIGIRKQARHSEA